MKRFSTFNGVHFDKEFVNAWRVTNEFVEIYLFGKETPIHIGYTGDKLDIAEQLQHLLK